MTKTKKTSALEESKGSPSGDPLRDLKMCPRCKELKDTFMFYRDAGKRDGRRTHCKKCCVERDRSLRRRSRPTVLENKRRFYLKHREEILEAGHMRKRRDAEKTYAQSCVSNAVASGRLLRPTSCPSCKSREYKIEAHHPDYSKPLDVLWLCRLCHSEEHLK